MAYGNQFKSAELDGSAFSSTYSTEAYPVGTIAVQQADEVVDAKHSDGTTALGLKGDRTWIFVQAIAAILIYDCCIVSGADSATASFGVIQSDAAGDNPLDVVGVAQNAIAINYYGWIVCRGECVVKGNSGLTAGQLLDTHTSGNVDDSTVVGTLIGKSLSALNTPVTGTVRARIRLP